MVRLIDKWGDWPREEQRRVSIATVRDTSLSDFFTRLKNAKLARVYTPLETFVRIRLRQYSNGQRDLYDSETLGRRRVRRSRGGSLVASRTPGAAISDRWLAVPWQKRKKKKKRRKRRRTASLALPRERETARLTNKHASKKNVAFATTFAHFRNVLSRDNFSFVERHIGVIPLPPGRGRVIENYN